MANTFLPQASLFLGIIPALLLLYISIKGYEGLYKEKNLFITFVVGIIIGFFAVLVETLTLGVGIFFIILYPLLEQLFKTIILNIGRFQGKKETTIYGLSLGLGFGAIFIPFSMITTQFEPATSLSFFILVFIGSFGIILLHGATGVYIGYGISMKKLIHYVMIAILLELPVTGLIFLTTITKVEYLQIGLVFYSIIIYWYATTKIMPRIHADYRREQRKKG